MCAAINLSRGTSAIAVMIDNARALITTLSIICLHFVFHDFSFIFVMESEDKYKTSGGNSCAVHACSNNRKKIILWKKSMCELHGQIHDQCPCLIPYRLHVMPSKEYVRLEWIKALNGKELPKKVFVCSEHFIDGKPTDRNPYPKLKLGYEIKATPGRRKTLRQDSAVKKRKLNDDSSDSDMGISEFDSTLENEPGTSASSDSKLPEAFCTFNVVESATTGTIGTQYMESDYLPQTDHTYGKEWTDFQSRFSQTNVILTEEKGVQSKCDGGTMSAALNINTDSDALLYTGVTKEVFFTLVKCMSQFNTFKFQLEVTDQIMLVLLKLKLNLIFEDLGRRFGISSSLACKIFNSWIPVLSDKLKSLIIWLPREVIRDCCPDSFRENYPRTTCIIDCAETFIQRPTNLRSRGETYSNYKSHNTVKYLVGISPHGQIMFISKAFGGRASDKFIVEKSGFMNYLLPGDEIMADRGFTIDDLLFPLRVKLNIPAFTKNKPQLSAEDVTLTRRIARVRIHVERAIRRLKVFKILSGTVPVASLKLFDDILIMCAALVNLRSDLIRDTNENDD